MDAPGPRNLAAASNIDGFENRIKTMADIRKEDRNGKGRYAQAMPDGQDAYLTFVETGPGHMIIDYSFVPQAYRGKNLAVPLIRKAVEDARVGGVRISPLCGYVAAVFRRHPDWADVLNR